MSLSEWIGSYKRITVVATMVTAVIAAAFAIANALQAGEPHWVATRSFVRDTIVTVQARYDKRQQELQSQQIQTEIQVLRGRIEQMRSKIADRELLLQKQEGPAEYRQLVQEQVADYKNTLALLNDQLAKLRASR